MTDPRLAAADSPWQRLHTVWLQAVNQQTNRDLRDDILQATGQLAHFMQAVDEGLVVVSARFVDGRLWYVAQLRVADAWAPLVSVPAAVLGLDDPGTVTAEAAWQRMGLLDPRAPDDCRELTDSPPTSGA